MKQSLSPAVVGVVIVLVVVALGFFLWKGTGGGNTKAPGAVGNAGPFAPGGVANSQGGKPAAATGNTRTSMPGSR